MGGKISENLGFQSPLNEIILRISALASKNRLNKNFDIANMLNNP